MTVALSAVMTAAGSTLNAPLRSTSLAPKSVPVLAFRVLTVTLPAKVLASPSRVRVLYVPAMTCVAFLAKTTSPPRVVAVQTFPAAFRVSFAESAFAIVPETLRAPLAVMVPLLARLASVVAPAVRVPLLVRVPAVRAPESATVPLLVTTAAAAPLTDAAFRLAPAATVRVSVMPRVVPFLAPPERIRLA